MNIPSAQKKREQFNNVIADLEKLGYRAYVFRSFAPDYDVYLVIEF